MIEVKTAAELKPGDVLASGNRHYGQAQPLRDGEVVTRVQNWHGWIHVWTDTHSWGIGPQLPTSKFRVHAVLDA